MASITGIELKPDSCILAAIRPSRGGVDVSALHSIAPADWPGQDLALSDALRSARIRRRLPRRARVVVWGLPDHGSADDPATLALLRPFTTAGFKIQSVVTPPQALAALATQRPREAGAGAVAWVALNTHGTAIAIVRGTELLYSRTFDWLYTPGEAGSTAQLLQRYTLVAHLAPELRHGMSTVRAAHGVTVETAVTCGDLPDLRSLTMPLIEELDLEVETLDSSDGLRPMGRARQERFAELAPAMRLACATAAIAPSRARAPGLVRQWIPVAAVATLVTAGVGYVYWSAPTLEPPQPAAVRPSTPNPPAGLRSENLPSPPAQTQGRAESNRGAEPNRGTKPGTDAKPGTETPSGAAPQTASSGAPRDPILPGTVPGRSTTPAVPSASPPPAPPGRSSTPAPPGRSSTPAPPGQSSTPAQQTAPSAAPTSRPPAATPFPTATERPAPPKPPGSPADKPTERVAPASPPTKQEPVRTAPPVVAPQPAPAVPPIASAPPVTLSRTREPRNAPVAQPLKQPLPRIDSILIDRDRRLAFIDGAILGVGDAVGPRTIVQIERDAIILREPSGLEIRVRLRSSGAGSSL